MKARIKKGIVAAAVAVATAATLTIGNAGSTSATPPRMEAFALVNDGALMAAFYTDTPQILNWVRAPQLVDGETRLVGIDFRVQNNTMYGVGNLGNIYTIQVPPQVPDVTLTKVSKLELSLYGTFFGVDFNPAADRLRVISDNGQNLRHNLNDHTTIEDSPLSTPPTPGVTRGVTGAAYTNNDLNAATATTLFGINTTTDQVVIQSPANFGTLAPTGSLGFDAGPNAGFDIYSELSGGKTVAVTGFAALTNAAGTSSAFYNVNLFTGEVSQIGTRPFPLLVTDVTLPLAP
jgi:hypothetical protein